MLRLPVALPAALRCLRLAVTALSSRFAPRRGRAHLPGSSGLFTRSHPGFCAETIGPPGSLGSPLARMPRSSTAAERDDARHCATSPAAFRFLDSVGLRTPLLTRLNHAACVLPVYASQRQPPTRRPTLRNTRFPLLARLCGASLTRWAPQRSFQRRLYVMPSPSSKFAQRTQNSAERYAARQ